MIRRVVQIHHLDRYWEVKQNLEYWLSRSPAECLAAVEELRREVYGDLHRLQRVARVVQMKDAADIEALGGE
ncbi:MAG: hypothetical protein NTZ17_21640 [Phycisphaerae bacterium]|nr:hypothetical protein [Phycisphaerae bacterium]